MKAHFFCFSLKQLCHLEFGSQCICNVFYSPLLLASLNGHSDCVRVLLDDGHASFDVIDNRGQTALHTAVHQVQFTPEKFNV